MCIVGPSIKEKKPVFISEKRYTLRAFAPFMAIEVLESGVLKENHKIIKNPEDEQFM